MGSVPEKHRRFNECLLITKPDINSDVWHIAWLSKYCILRFSMNSSRPSDKYMRQYTNPILVMTCRSAHSHYLNQCWHIVNGGKHMDKLRWIYFRYSNFSWTKESPFENVVCKIMAAILFRLQRWNSITVVYFDNLVNSLWPSDAIWRQGSGSTLAQVMVCCLAAPSHYLNQCWLIISKTQWHSYNENCTRDTSVIKH